MKDRFEDWPLDSRQHIEEALREQGEEDADDLAELVSAVEQLKAWTAPQPSLAQQRALFARLAPALPIISPIRQSIKQNYASSWSRLHIFFQLALVQVSLLQPSFWLLSFMIVLAGFTFLSFPLANSVLMARVVFWALGPLVAYIGAMSIFRGMQYKTLEFELACPPSAQQITLARLMIVLGYDIGLGLLLSAGLLGRDGGSFFVLILHWLAPMLLVSAMALFFSFRISANLAAGLTYSIWLGLLVFFVLPLGHRMMTGTVTEIELAVATLGSGLLVVAVFSQPGRMRRAYPI